MALVGSGPSALEYTGAEDMSIALNGAIALPHVFDYFVAIDSKVPEREYWPISRGEKRLLGELVARHEYREYELLKYRSIVHPEPPVANFNEPGFAVYGNVSHIGIQLAYSLRPHEIRVYGIDLGGRRYFDGPNLGGTYGGRLNTAPCLHYMQSWIDGIRDRGVAVTIRGSEDCRIT